MFPSSRARFLFFIFFSLSSSSGARLQEIAQTPPNIRIGVDRVNVGIVVTDSSGQFAGGLRREDFHVFDNGAEQKITDFLTNDDPAQVLLLIEAGPAAYLLEGGHLQAIHALLNGLSPGDRVGIARYNEAAEPILDFTPDKLTAAAALDELRFNLGFAQLNLASSLATSLEWLTGVPGKKSLILLSTGIDTSPPAAVQDLLVRLKSSDVRLLAISLGVELRGGRSPEKSHSKNAQPPPEKIQVAAEAFAEADAELRTIVRINGGRAYFPKTSKDFAGIFNEVAQLIRHEYNLSFVPPEHDGKLHSIKVRIAGASASTYRLDHRQAYVAPGQEQYP